MFTKIYEKIKNYILNNYKFLLSIIVLILLFYVELPFVIYKPGGSINLNKRVIVEDGYKSSGSFEMAYVALVKGNIPFLLVAKILPDWDIESSSEVTIENDSVKDTLKKEKISLEEAIDNATIVAYSYAGKEVKIDKINNNVIYIVAKADTTIKEYDKIVAVEDKEVNSLAELKNEVNKYSTGDILNIKVIRGNKEITTTAKVYDEDGDKKIGVIITTTYDLTTKPDIHFKTKYSESGPSGGLMSALSIYNALVSNDITKGRKIVGTGTIDASGNVGEIGGVKYKLMGAVNNKADIFICPSKNYDEAKEVAIKKGYDIDIISVDTFADAIEYLEK